MKKPLLFLTIASMILGGLAFLIKPKVSSVNALDPNAHLFVQVEKESDLRVGDTVFIGTLGGTIFHSLGGNPVFSTGSHMSGRSEDGKKYYTSYTADYQEALLMQVETGAYENTWSFKSIRSDAQETDYAHPTRGRYLAYGHEYHDKKYSNIQAYGDVNMADDKGQYTSWTVEFRGDEHYAIMKYYGEQYDTHIQWVYYGSTARNNFGYYTNNTDIVIYKEIAVDQGTGRVSLDIFTHPDQTTVYEGDYLDLTGLEMRVTIDKNEETELSFVATYEMDYNFFTVSAAAKNAVRIYCTYANWNFNFEATVIEDTSSYTYYNEVKTQKGDYRGSYLLVHQEGSSIYQMKRDLGLLTYDKGSEDAPINSSMADNNITINLFNILRKRIAGVSYMFLQINHSQKYVISDGENLDDTFYEEDLTTASAITVDSNLNVHIGDGILYFTGYDFAVSNSPSMNSRVKLYKRIIDYEDTTNTTNYNTFMSNFSSITSANCDASGEDDTTITSTQWNNLKTNFDNIANDICGYDFQGYIANTTYEHNAENGTGSIKEMMDRYDYIISKYQASKGFDDFIDRKINPSYQNNYHSSLNLLTDIININSRNTTIYIIAAVCLFSLAGLVTYYAVKRKKQQ